MVKIYSNKKDLMECLEKLYDAEVIDSFTYECIKNNINELCEGEK